MTTRRTWLQGMVAASGLAASGIGFAKAIPDTDANGLPVVQSKHVLVLDARTGQALLERDSAAVTPIASITKLMTALVMLEAKHPLGDLLSIHEADIDTEKNSRSRLGVGQQYTRANLLQLALMSSENRAASALGRSVQGGTPAFVAAMNARAQSLGMSATRFADTSGLSPRNVSTARDLAKLVAASNKERLIREYTTAQSLAVTVSGRRGDYVRTYGNSNRLTAHEKWDIALSKTGFIEEAGRCLVMQATVARHDLIFVLLNSWGKYSRLGDAGRIRKWLEGPVSPLAASGRTAQS
jgi:serine-type D-Ala-D-Ala endopeptidase (penicillin-binding protein 7)